MGKKIIRRVAGASTDANERTINSDDFSRRARASEIDRLVRNVRPVVDTLTVTVSHALPAAPSLSLSAWRLEQNDVEPKEKVPSKRTRIFLWLLLILCDLKIIHATFGAEENPCR
jgi:hypothetical protein